jgi:competence protein ComEC
MDERVLKIRMVVVVTLLLSAVFAWWSEISPKSIGTDTCDPTLLCVAFLDVGQGDAIFIQSPSGTQMLIDAGRDQSVLRELATVLSFSDRTLDYILATHPDADHITGFKEVLERYEIDNVIRTENESGTPIEAAVLTGIESERATVHLARRGQRYDLGSGVWLEILFPDVDPSAMETNTSSIVARLVYGQTAFMLTGDAPKSIEEYLVLVEGENLKSDVLKVGHHGSRTSTSELFLAEVDPTYAVISAGTDNPYGHPHVEVTDTLFNYGVSTSNTGEVGRVVFWSDGKSVSVK